MHLLIECILSIFIFKRKRNRLWITHTYIQLYTSDPWKLLNLSVSLEKYIKENLRSLCGQSEKRNACFTRPCLHL